jgi:SAM-dependent methyltransferase
MKLAGTAPFAVIADIHKDRVLSSGCSFFSLYLFWPLIRHSSYIVLVILKVFNFNNVADRYDRWYDTPRGAIYDRFEKKVVDKLLKDQAEGKRLLEVGCGTGHWSKFFSTKGYEITGIDISERMVTIAKNKNIARSSFHVMDGHCMSFADNSFDIAAAITILEFATAPYTMIAEMARCVRKPGGKLLFGVLNALSEYNQKRKNKAGSPYASATLFSPEQLLGLLAPLGQVQMIIAGFVPRQGWLFALAPVFELAGRLMKNRHGAFIAAEVQL